MSALACASHLLVDLPLFGAPVLFVVGAVLLIRRSERRRFAAAADQAGAGGSVDAASRRAAVLPGRWTSTDSGVHRW